MAELQTMGLRSLTFLAVSSQATALQLGCLVWNVHNIIQHENVSPNLFCPCVQQGGVKIIKLVQIFCPSGILCSIICMGREKKDFLISRQFDPPTNSLKIIKETPKKYKGKIAISVFWVLCKILFPEKYSTAFRSISLIRTDLLIPILAYFVTFYVICHKMSEKP